MGISQLKIVKLCTRTMSFSVIFVRFVDWPFLAVYQTISESDFRMKGLKECCPKELKRWETLEFGVILCLARRQLCKQWEDKTRKNVFVPLNERRHKDLTEFKRHVMSFTDLRMLPFRRRFAGIKFWHKHCLCIKAWQKWRRRLIHSYTTSLPTWLVNRFPIVL